MSERPKRVRVSGRTVPKPLAIGAVSLDYEISAEYITDVDRGAAYALVERLVTLIENARTDTP